MFVDVMGRVIAGAALLTIAVAMVGCEEDVTAVTGTDLPFSLYGVFIPDQDTQWVRVYAVESSLRPIEPEPMDAVFSSTDMTTGDLRIWNDSLMRERDGSWAHIFWSPFRAEYGHDYRVEVAHENEAPSTVHVRVPNRSEILVPDPERYPEVLLPVLVPGDVPRLMKITLEYYVKYDDGPPEETTRSFAFAYDGVETKVEEGWLLPIRLSSEFDAMRDTLRNAAPGGDALWNPRYGLALLSLTLRLSVVSEDWVPPTGVFDPELLVEPGTMSNVENGFGFVGAGYVLEKALRPSQEMLITAGFRPLGGVVP